MGKKLTDSADRLLEVEGSIETRSQESLHDQRLRAARAGGSGRGSTRFEVGLQEVTSASPLTSVSAEPKILERWNAKFKNYDDKEETTCIDELIYLKL